MSNFDFLKKFNNDLYNIGNKLEEDVIESPRAVPADATLFLETLVKDIYRLSKTKLKSDELPFYQKIDFLYRSGVITYIYKNKLQDAYNLRNKIHRNYKNTAEEGRIALDLHQRLYYISKKYFRDFSEVSGYVEIPDYKKPNNREIHFENCIICGAKNNDINSNMCSGCNAKIENANYIMSLKNSFGKEGYFKREDLYEYGLNEGECISLIMNLTRENLIFKKGEQYRFNERIIAGYIENVDEYVKIGILLNNFYRDEISSAEIKDTIEYWRGSKNQKPCVEFYRLVNIKIEHNFEKAILESENIQRSIKKSSISRINILEWFNREKEWFIRGSINEAFITFNELLIKDYFRFKKKGFDEDKIKKHLRISDDILVFWSGQFMGEDFLKQTSEIKKDLIIKELKKDRSLKEALKSCGISRKEFDKLYIISKNNDDEFYHEFIKNYTQKRQNLLIKNLNSNTLGRAIRKSKITNGDFMNWYMQGEVEYSKFYLDSTKILMDQYLKARKQGANKQDILRKLTLPKEILQSWSKHDDLDLFRDFKIRNEEITSSLLKRGLIINAIKDDKSKSEAIKSAKITPEEFDEIYRTSIREKTDFHQRFNMEYAENRKRLFVRLLKDNDFYNSIVKCEITQKEFNQWYAQDEAEFMDGGRGSEFYINATGLLMGKYLDSRRNGKNRPDSARSVGLSNATVDKWMRHQEFELYRDFKNRLVDLHVELIVDEFRRHRTKLDVYRECDISVRTIEHYINKGKKGMSQFREMYELYEKEVIPKQLELFLHEVENKTLKRSLKNAKLSEKEMKYYYNLGKNDDGRFTGFYQEYLELKILLYCDAILSKKSHRIAMKNSNLSREEFEANENDIDDMILKARLRMLCDKLIQGKASTSQLSGISGVSVEELYRWYFRGKNGDETYEEFSSLFELGIITPKTMAINRALGLGIPKNKLMKKLKKDIGAKDFRIWEEYGIINSSNSHVQLDTKEIDHEEALDLLKKSEFLKHCYGNRDPEIYNLMNQAARGNLKSLNESAVSENEEELKNEIIGK